MLNEFLRNLAEKLKGNSEYPIEKQKKYISKFREPRSLVERSFFQYKAQMKLKGFWITFFINLASVPLFFVYFLKPSKRVRSALRADAVFVKDGGVNDNILPRSLCREFETLESEAKEGNRLRSKDRGYILKLLLRHPLSWHFALKAEIKIMRYRWFIDLYQPKALIVHNEYSFTSSLLTDFCNRNGVELINVMHGEKLYYIGVSFFKFNRCYVWSEFYRDLLCELRAERDQFIIELPPSLIFSVADVQKYADYTYYLQNQTGESLKGIIDNLKYLAGKGEKVVIRPHPRFTNQDELKRYVSDCSIEIEDGKTVTIERSIQRTKNVISMFSTVLLQAHCNGVNIVIDDISDPKLIARLKEVKYAMLNCEHILLSDLMTERSMSTV